jgi:inosine-uridine nucleoside N-ribohydrolase
MTTTLRRSTAALASLLLISSVAACDLAEGDHVTAVVRSGPLPALDVVVDTDMLPDDWLAILYLASEPNVTIRAVTVADGSVVGCAAGVAIARDLLADVGEAQVPVACGPPASPGGTPFPAEWAEGTVSVARSLGWTADDGDPPGAPTDPTDAISLIRKVVADGPVTIVSLGPPTNVAALFSDPTWDRKGIERIVQMAGAVDVPGNVEAFGSVKAMPSVEWNAAVDPVALATVLDGEVEVILVSLDGTNSVPLRPADVARMTADRSTKAATILASILESQREFAEAGGYYLCDVLGAVTTRQSDVARIESIPVRVSLASGEAGRTVRDPAGREVRVTMEADAEGFERILLDAVLGRAR